MLVSVRERRLRSDRELRTHPRFVRSVVDWRLSAADPGFDQPGDDAALAAVDPAAGAVRLLVERGASGPEVTRLDAAAWHFAAELCRGFPLGIVLAELSDASAEKAFAAHLAAGRFVDFRLAPPELMASPVPSGSVP